MASWLESAPPEEIDAGVLLLRRWRPSDAEDLARLVRDNLEHLRPWMAWAQKPPSVEEEVGVLGRMEHGWDELTDFVYAVTLHPAETIGGIGLHTRQGPGTMEIGYWIAARHTGRGYATRASRAVAEAAFALPGVDRVEIRCDEANHASAAVPRKLGFRLVDTIMRRALAPRETGRGMIWAVRRGEWHPRSEAG